MSTSSSDPVRKQSTEKRNARVDRETRESVSHYASASHGEITARIKELESEWDVERYLEMFAPMLSLTGVALAARGDRRWLLLPTVVLSFLVQHAVQGWCPPLPMFQSMGVRTRKEIDRERYALKAIRGDFDRVSKPAEEDTAKRAALRAVHAADA